MQLEHTAQIKIVLNSTLLNAPIGPYKYNDL